MFALLKSEFRKLFTVRSTYITSGLALLLVIGVSVYPEGYKLAAADLASPLQLNNDVTGSVTVAALFCSLIALLLVTHEYRYNTIMYSLTSSSSRVKSLLSKMLIITAFSLVFTAVIDAIAPLFSVIGVHLAGHALAPQTIYYHDILWRTFFYGWGMIMFAFLLAALIRNQIGAIVTFLILPSTVENLLGLILKSKVVYLPFTALGSVIQENHDISYRKAALVSGIYIIVGSVIAFTLFLKRDAN